MACWSYCHASHPEVWGSIPVFFFSVSSDTRPLVSQGRVCRFFPLFAPLLLPLPLGPLGALRPLVGRARFFFVSSDTRPLVSQGRVCRFFPLFAPLLLTLPLGALGALRPLVGRARFFFRVFRHETSRVSREGVPLFPPLSRPFSCRSLLELLERSDRLSPFFFPCLQTRDISCLKGGCAAFSPSFAPLLLPLPLLMSQPHLRP